MGRHETLPNNAESSVAFCGKLNLLAVIDPAVVITLLITNPRTGFTTCQILPQQNIHHHNLTLYKLLNVIEKISDIYLKICLFVILSLKR